MKTSRKRELAIQIRVTEEEKKVIERQSQRENFSGVSAFIRKVLLDRCKSTK